MDYNKVFKDAIAFGEMPKNTPDEYANVLFNEMNKDIADEAPLNDHPAMREILKAQMFPKDEPISIFVDVTDGDYASYVESFPEKYRHGIVIVLILRYLIKTKGKYFNTDQFGNLLTYTMPAIHGSLS